MDNIDLAILYARQAAGVLDVEIPSEAGFIDVVDRSAFALGRCLVEIGYDYNSAKAKALQAKADGMICVIADLVVTALSCGRGVGGLQRLTLTEAEAK